MFQISSFVNFKTEKHPRQIEIKPNFPEMLVLSYLKLCAGVLSKMSPFFGGYQKAYKNSPSFYTALNNNDAKITYISTAYSAIC